MRAHGQLRAFAAWGGAQIQHPVAILRPERLALAPAGADGVLPATVSEAVYLADPEGNGIELYVDRPRDQWVRENGELKMGTLFLDPNEYLRTHLEEATLDSVTIADLIRDNAPLRAVLCLDRVAA